MGELIYHNPIASTLIALLPFLILLSRRLHLMRQRGLDLFADQELHKTVLLPRSRFYSAIHLLLISLCWLMAVLALMEPTWRSPEQPKRLLLSEKVLSETSPVENQPLNRPKEIAIVIDTSASMNARDTPTGISRLDYAKEAAEEIIDRLKGEHLAIYAFTSELTPIVPSTLDYLYSRILLRDLDLNAGGVAGTNFQNLIEGLKHHYWEKESNRLSTLIIFSDGGDTAYEELSSEDKLKAVQGLKAVIAEETDPEALRIITVGMGSEQGVRLEEFPVTLALNPAVLREVGSYIDSNQETLQAIAEIALKKANRGGESVAEAADREPPLYDTPLRDIPLLFALLFLAASLLLPSASLRKVS